MTSDEIKDTITNSASEIVRLHNRVREALEQLDGSEEKSDEYNQGCAEFHAHYDRLAFPGGYEGALQRISSGEPDAIEAGICFLELRPYFFRSGYMFKDILRKCKHAQLSESQVFRLATVIQKREDWQAAHPRPHPD